MVGTVITRKGCFTLQKYLQGQTLREIESRLGFNLGRLKEGACFAIATEIPKMEDFELAGYTQVATHRTKDQYGNINKPASKGESDAYKIKKSNAMSDWSVSGTNRLIKVMPKIGHSNTLSDDEQYPAGTGIPQWNLIKPINWKIISFVGGYPAARFIPDEGFTAVRYF